MKEKLLGKYQLGYRMVEVYINPESYGGWFNLCLSKQNPQIHLGLKESNFGVFMGLVCHEAWEMAAQDMRLVYKPLSFEEAASDCVSFAYNHNQHTEVCSKVGWFIYCIYEDLKKAHKEAHKRK